MKNIFLLGFLCILNLPILAQSIVNYESYWDDYLIRNLGVVDGMAAEQVFYTFEDSLGFIWVINSGGLYRYDGIHIKHFSKGFEGGFLYEIHQDENDDYWIPSTGGGLHKFNGSSFTQFKKELGAPNGLIKTMAISDSNKMLLGIYGEGFFEFDGTTVTKKLTTENGLISNSIWRIIVDRNDRVWIGTDNGLSIYDGQDFINFTVENGLPYNTIRGLTEMDNGDVWVGTDKEGIVIFKDYKPQTYFHIKDGLSNSYPQFFAENPIDGSIWIAHHGKGVDVYRNGEFENFNEDHGLPSNYTTYVGFSKDGTGFVGSEQGLSVFTKKIIQTIDERTRGFDNTPSISVLEDVNQIVWLGLEGKGIRYFNDGIWKSLENPPLITNGYSNGAVADPNGGVWFGTQGTGLIHIENGEIKKHITKKDGLIDNFIGGLAFDNNGKLWVGTNKGINLIDPFTYSIDKSYTQENGLNNLYTIELTSTSDGSIWHGSYSGNLTRFKDDIITTYDSLNGLPYLNIFALFEHSNKTIYISTYNKGLTIFRNESFSHFGLEKGLPNTTFFEFAEDEYQNLWLSSSSGIYKIEHDQLELLAYENNQPISFTKYTIEDGLTTNILESGQNSPAKSIHTGEILFTSSKGLIVVNPETSKISTENFFPYIDDFIVDEKLLDINNHIKLTPDDKKIEISYSALNIHSPRKTKFRIKLDGIDEDWIYVDKRTTAYYDYLPDGYYNFMVSAVGPDGQWSEKIASISFTVLPPFYKTWWFMGLCLVGFVSLGAGGVQIRSNLKFKELNRKLEIQRKIQGERERISMELHDNVGSQITNLITGIEISNLHIKKNQQDKALSLLHNLDSDARGAMTDLRETIWLLNKEEVQFGIFLDHLKGFINRQKHYLNGMKVCINSDVDKGRILNPTQSLNLTRIIQEALNNSRKYAQSDSFHILFTVTNQRIVTTLTDHGIGMELNTNFEKGNGIKNMRNRSEEIGGTLQIKTAIDKGTTIIFEF